ncbi:hypothetical protein QEZ54_35425 [Catellatospora sp. KI3]|uniref:hypothetical protein n=1 Tax=Catellatospora sp. KI3 TaxID=3041620 RepID=UPI0024832709|nr:hypothetical protein [Catellatospora sp. KI3]MDI1466282.1 hypothetical protein [Catellatospora sp. KI3]
MPSQAIAAAAAPDPGTGPLNWNHPLAELAARHCQATHLVVLTRPVACEPCWDAVLLADWMFAAEFDLPLDVEVDPSYVDDVAVDRAVKAARDADAQDDDEAAWAHLALTDAERAEVRRRLAEIRTRRNRRYRFVCSRAAAARRDADR